MTYSRLNHLERTVDSLLRSNNSEKSILYVLLDGPKKGDEIAVEKVKKYVTAIKGFKDIILFERSVNGRVESYIEGVGKILEEHGCMIFLEDDNVVAPSFIDIMNDALRYFENDMSILAINGYNIPIKNTKKCQNNYYLSYYFNAWGFATWKNRMHLEIEMVRDGYLEVISNNKLKKKVEMIHPGLISGLKMIYDQKLIAGDYNLTFHSIKNDVYSVRPVISLVDNIGHDGSGLHCSKKHFKRNDLDTSPTYIDFKYNVKYDKKMDSLYYSYFRGKKKKLKAIRNAIKKMVNKNV